MANKRASQLIAELQAAIAAHGDCEIFVVEERAEGIFGPCIRVQTYPRQPGKPDFYPPDFYVSADSDWPDGRADASAPPKEA